MPPIIDTVKYKFTYYPIPKNASTSVKRWIYDYIRSCDPTKFDPEPLRSIHEYFSRPERDGGYTGPKIRSTFKFAIVRDPRKRFISAYRNRVLHYKCLSKYKEQLRDKGLSVTPNINDFILNYERYASISGEVAQHCAPQVAFIGNIYDKLDKIYGVGHMDILEKDLANLVGHGRPIEVSQTGGKEHFVDKLNPSSEKFLNEFLREDYEMMEQLEGLPWTKR